MAQTKNLCAQVPIDLHALVCEAREAAGQAAIDKRLKLYAQAANKICPDVPLRLHAHQFRHAKATHWLEDGINIVQISFLLGHEQLQTTMRYLDITTEDKVKALSTLENEQEKGVRKKWKNMDTTLAHFCGLS